jgi:hypothetical protein
MGAAMLVYFTSLTLCRMPHDALGAELSRDHERTCVFG